MKILKNQAIMFLIAMIIVPFGIFIPFGTGTAAELAVATLALVVIGIHYKATKENK